MTLNLKIHWQHISCSFTSRALTRGVTAQKLNRLFWQGVILGFNFTIMLACCDGAPENRAFMNMNGNNASKSKCYNPFSRKPLFFISDSPHLLKKLRNNIYTSGFKCQNSRFTRLLKKNGKYLIISKPGNKNFNKHSTEGQMCHNTS